MATAMGDLVAFKGRTDTGTVVLDTELGMVEGHAFGLIVEPGTWTARLVLLTPDRMTAHDVCTVKDLRMGNDWRNSAIIMASVIRGVAHLCGLGFIEAPETHDPV